MKFLTLICGLLMAGAVGAAAQVTGCWDIWEHTDVDLAYSGPGAVSLLVVPDGSGPAMTQARDQSGSVFDATVTVVLRDCIDVPVANFPREDMWLATTDGGLVPCAGGTIADSNTDANGVTTWVAPWRAGGASQAGCRLYINGDSHPQPLALHVNSPDINGDRRVNLTDVPPFAADYYGPYAYRSDLRRDGTINLSDVVALAQALGAECP